MSEFVCSHMCTLAICPSNVSSTDVRCRWSVKPRNATTLVSDMFEKKHAVPQAGSPLTSEEESILREVHPDEFGVGFLLSDAMELQSPVFAELTQLSVSFDKTLSQKEIDQIEKETRGQSENLWWHKFRKNRLTASNFATDLSCLKTSGVELNKSSKAAFLVAPKI